jgi:hypothetical protein
MRVVRAAAVQMSPVLYSREVPVNPRTVLNDDIAFKLVK